jgi:nucleoside diphosphate kinase
MLDASGTASAVAERREASAPAADGFRKGTLRGALPRRACSSGDARMCGADSGCAFRRSAPFSGAVGESVVHSSDANKNASREGIRFFISRRRKV